MKKYLLNPTGNFYKANLHCHTTLSDGSRTPEEIKELYKAKGYSIVAYTDHDILIPHPDLTDSEFLALNAFEVEINEAKPVKFDFIKCCHICFIGLEPDNVLQPLWHREWYLFANAVNYRDQVQFDENEPDYVRKYTPERISDMMQKAREKGFFVTYNHPAWSRENYANYIDYKGMHAMEMFNGSCICAGYEDYNHVAYDDLLGAGNKIYCIGGDDNHNRSADTSRYSDSGWAFTMIKADKLEYRTVTKALEDGQFYASTGPEIYELWVEDGRVHIKCSPADSVKINFQYRRAQRAMNEDGSLLTEASFDIPEGYGYFRLTVEDGRGKYACTNAYFPEDI